VDALLTQALSSFLREETLKGNLPKKQKEKKTVRAKVALEKMW